MFKRPNDWHSNNVRSVLWNSEHWHKIKMVRPHSDTAYSNCIPMFGCRKCGPFPNTVFDCRICQAISIVRLNQAHPMHWDSLSMRNNTFDGWGLKRTELITEQFISIVILRNFAVYIWSVHQFGCNQGENVCIVWNVPTTIHWPMIIEHTYCTLCILPFALIASSLQFGRCIMFWSVQCLYSMWLFGSICNMWNILCVQVLNEDELENVTHCKCMSNHIPTLLTRTFIWNGIFIQKCSHLRTRPICALTHRSLIQCLYDFIA